MSRHPVVALSAVLVLVLGTLTACLQASDPDPSPTPATSDASAAIDPPPAEAGAPSETLFREAPHFVQETLRGGRIDSYELRGRVVVLNFWATWCPPCREEIPDLAAVHRSMESDGVMVVGVSVDAEGAAVVRPFIDRMDVPYPILLDPEMELAEVYGGNYAFPTTFVIDRDGQIRQRFMRAVTPADLRPVIEPLL